MLPNADKTALVYFVFNRPECVQNILPLHIKYSKDYNIDLIVVCDGPKTESDRYLQKELKSFLNTYHVHVKRIILNGINLGLKENIQTNLDKLSKEYNQLLVFEEDVFPTRQSYEFILRMLKIYALNDQILSINSYSPVNLLGSIKYFKHPVPHSWGWATWSDRWIGYRSQNIDINLSRLPRGFDLFGAFPYRKMLKENIDGIISSWAIMFYYYSFTHGKSSITPTKTLIRNVGFGKTATHTKGHSLNFYNEKLKVKENISLDEVVKSANKNRILLAYARLSIKNKLINIVYFFIKRIRKIRS